MHIRKLFRLPMFEAPGEGGGEGGGQDDGTDGAALMNFDFSTLSESNQALAASKTWTHETDLNQVFDSYNSLEKKVGKNTIEAPEADKLSDFFEANKTSFGIPETVDGYEFDKVDLPEGMSIDDAEVGLFKEIIHGSNIPPAIAKNIYAKISAGRIDAYNQAQQTKQTLHDEFIAKKETEYGDKFEAKQTSMNNGMEALGISLKDIGLLDSLTENSDKLINALILVGEMNADGYIPNADGNTPSGSSKEDLVKELGELEKNNKVLLTSHKNAPGRKELLEKRADLIRKMAKAK